MITDRKTNRSSVSRQSSRRPSNSQSIDDRPAVIIKKSNFVTDYLKFCKDYDVFPLPEFHIIAAGETLKIISTISDDRLIENDLQNREEEFNEFSKLQNQRLLESESVTVFGLIYENLVQLDAPKYLRCRGCKLNAIMLDALNNCTKKFDTITTLKLQRCSINAKGIVQISEILATKSGRNITDLNLDVNPNLKQNHHLLCAPGSSLLYLSLKLCEINDDGVRSIASNLSYRDEPHPPKLILLNLANNRVSEIGAKAIANMLRNNRSLQSLTLTGNRINDAGAEYVIEQLSTFTLTQAEVFEKRCRKLHRFKLCREKMDDLSLNEALKIQSSNRGVEESRVMKKRRASSRQVISNSSESSANRSTPVIVVQSLKERAESMIPADTHPLVKDVIPINGTLTCPGNFKLQHLNLSFNKIGEDTLQRIIDCVKEQRSVIITNDFTKGLLRVEVEGNEFYGSSDLVQQLRNIKANFSRVI